MKENGKEINQVYINEIIRITYRCNWRCKFCNVLKTNNFGENDVSSKEIIYQILNLAKKYSIDQLQGLILSFSGGEPTLDKNLCNYIKLAKKIGVGTIQIQTNGTTLFKKNDYINELIDAGLNEIFLAQHSFDKETNSKLGVFYNINDFEKWVEYVKENTIYKKIHISFNIVVNKINIYSIYDYLIFLDKIGFIDFLPLENNNGFLNTKRISFGLVQPNGYAEINKEEVLLDFNDKQVSEIKKIVELCKTKNIYSDFHFTAPPLCVIDFPEYNLEYRRLKEIEKDIKNGKLNEGNYDSYKNLWKEKKKYDDCSSCKNNNYCLGFYNNWIEFVGEKYVKKIIQNYTK